jgi:hypothetical protein
MRKENFLMRKTIMRVLKAIISRGCFKTSSFETAASKNAVSQGFSLRNGMSLSKPTGF